MVGEKAAHHVVLVAHARLHHIIGSQQQPRILDGAASQHGEARLHREARAAAARLRHRNDVELLDAVGIAVESSRPVMLLQL